MALSYLFDPNKQFQDLNGVNNVDGFLRVYYEGTDDRATTYKNFIGTLNPADIPIDNNGRAVVIVEDEKTYRLEVYARNGNLMWTQHPLYALVGGGEEYSGDVSDATCSFTKDSGDTSEMSSGSALKVLFTKISKFFASLKSVAFTGSYNDLSNKPSIPAAQVNSDWNANSGVAEILNKPDLSQYIQSSQKGAANGVGTLDANGVQPYSETYKGYYNSADTSSKVVKIGRFKTGSDTRDAGGVSFSIVYRGPTDKSSGQILLWLSTHNVNTSTKCYKTVLFNRGAGIDDNIIKVYTHSVTESSVNYVDLYATIGTWCSVRIVPLWGNPDTWTPVFTTASLPSGATEVSNTIFVKSAGAAGSESVPVHINNAGNAIPCTMATVASTGRYSDLLGKPSVPETFHKAFTINPLVQQTLTATDIANGYVDIELSLDANIGTGLGYIVWTIGLPNSDYSGWKLAQMYDRIEVYTHGDNLQLLAVRYDDLTADDYGNTLAGSDTDYVWNRTFTGNGTRLQEIDAFVVRCYLNSAFSWTAGSKAPIKIWFTSIG